MFPLHRQLLLVLFVHGDLFAQPQQLVRGLFQLRGTGQRVSFTGFVVPYQHLAFFTQRALLVLHCPKQLLARCQRRLTVVKLGGQGVALVLYRAQCLGEVWVNP